MGYCDSDIIRRFPSDSVIFLEPINAKAEELVTAERSYDELPRCIASVLERILTPDDALSNIREAIEDGTLSNEEAISYTAFVLSDGFDTTELGSADGREGVWQTVEIARGAESFKQKKH